MRVLNLVTSPDAEFFQLQVAALERRGVEQSTLGVGDGLTHTDQGMDSRSVFDYARFYSETIERSFGEYDLVHANYGLTAPPALLQSSVPVVLSLWGSDLFGPFGRLTRVCSRLADSVVVMSQDMADAVPARCHVIPHGVDLRQFRPFPGRQARSAVGWSQATHHVLFPYPKASEVKDYPRAERVVAAARERFDGRIQLHAIHGVPHARMPLYLNAADALLLTSRREGSPNSVKEALACNLPVVATDVGDVRERLRDIDPAHVCRTDEELVTGLVDALERGPASNGREAVDSMGMDAMGERLQAVYRSVLDE